MFIAVAVFAMGLLLGLDPLVAQAFGASRIDECHGGSIAGVWLAILASVPMMGVIYAINASLPLWGLPPGVLALTQPYLGVLELEPAAASAVHGVPALPAGDERGAADHVDAGRREYLNAVANWVLIFGHLGAPALGVARLRLRDGVGAHAAWRSRCWSIILRRERSTTPRLLETRSRSTYRALRRLVELGFPAARADGPGGRRIRRRRRRWRRASRLTSLAAHQIAIHVASLTFMVPFGVASAAAVRVGQAIGRRDPRGAVRAGWTAIAIGVGFMATAAAILLACPVAAHARLHNRCGRRRDRRRRCCSWPRSSSCSTGCRASRRARCAGSATRAPPCCGIWAATGASDCRSATSSVFAGATGCVGLWWGLSLGLVICGIGLLATWMRKARERGSGLQIRHARGLTPPASILRPDPGSGDSQT